MKLEDDFQNLNQKVEFSQKKKQQIEYELISNLVPHKGHKIWEVNNKTLEVKEAVFVNIKKKTVVVEFGISFKEPVKEILQKKHHTYISALNKENALKKFHKEDNGSKKTIKNKWKL